jgi:predicted metalloprotease with PDZ domain
MLGRLSAARTEVTGVPISIYLYSPSGAVRSDQLLEAMQAMLRSTGSFLGKLPVDRYAFLFEFGPVTVGAWEHSLSSMYVLKDGPYTPTMGAAVTDMAAHEFFHIVTPLNIHSEIIEHFDFSTPIPSRHLWLYEGTTEWAAHKIQLETGLKSVDTYLSTVIQKLKMDHVLFDTAYSLRELALTSYSDSGQRQYPNIYSRGAVVAGLLDIRLLELSHGRRGLRELIQDLARDYGKHRAFPEDSLFDIIARRTSPEIMDFFERYVNQADHLPIKEYYAKLGITLVEDEKGLPARFVIDSTPTPEQAELRRAWLGQGHGFVP